jgi:hypothetical protein
MSQKTIILTVILFALIVIGMFTFAKLRSQEIDSAAQSTSFNQTRLV